MKIKVHLLKSFTKDPSQGNATGIVLDAGSLTDQQMLHVAKELNFAESVFIQKSDKANYRARFFAPEQEVALCGHGTIAAFQLLVETGRLSFVSNDELTVTQETLAGVLSITGHKDGLVIMTQKDPLFFPPETDRTLIAKLLGIEEKDICQQVIQTVSTGTPKLIIPLVSLEALMRVKPDLEGIKEYCRNTGAKGFYPYTTETKDKKSDFHARQFNPLSDINEDPVTGVAAGALGSYIKHNKLSDKMTFIVEQGYILNKAGNMYVDVTEGVKVGGYAVTYGEKDLEI